MGKGEGVRMKFPVFVNLVLFCFVSDCPVSKKLKVCLELS